MPETVRITSEATWANQAVNVFHFRHADAFTTSLANECITKIDTFYEAIKAFMRPLTWTHGNRVVTVDQEPNRVIAATPLTTTMTGTTNEVASAAACVSWVTQFIGREYRGRNYFGPLSGGATLSDGLQLDATFISTLLTAANALRTATAGGAQLAIYSRKLNTSEFVTGGSVRGGIKSQRGRLL